MENADRVRANTTEAIDRQIDCDLIFRVPEYCQRTASEIHPAHKRAFTMIGI